MAVRPAANRSSSPPWALAPNDRGGFPRSFSHFRTLGTRDLTADEKGGFRLTDLRPGVCEIEQDVEQQVKIRGFRVEPGEVEQALAAVPDTGTAAVVARESRPGEMGLAAWYTGGAEPREVRQALAESLPSHMMPSWISRLEEMPMTTTGKVDRKRLPEPSEANDEASMDVAPPQGTAEEWMVALWSDLLQSEAVGRDSDYFELGGHSLLIPRLLSRVEADVGVRLPIQVLFADTTPAALALAVQEALLDEIEAGVS